MARKKKKNDKHTNQISNEIITLILFLLGIISLGFGGVGVFLKKITIFLLGNLWLIIPVALISYGIISLFDKKEIKKNIILGTIILTIFGLTILHTYTFQNVDPKLIVSKTLENYMNKVSTLPENKFFYIGDPTVSIGTGFIGALLSFFFVNSIGLIGTKVISYICLMVSFFLITELNIINLLSKIKFKKKEKNNELEEVKITEANETKKEQIIISNIDQIKQTKMPTVQSFDVKKTSENSFYNLPQFNILDEIKNKINVSKQEINNNKEILEDVISDFGIQAKVVKVNVGPAVTQYEVTVPKGTKINKISSIHKEIALTLAARDVRIEAPIPGKSTIGIEIPNKEVGTVQIREVLEETANIASENKLYIALGKDIMGNSILGELTGMPHLLIAGSTGSGKSVAINTIIGSLLMRYTPNEARLLLIDPKKVELTHYNGIPYLLSPVVTDPKKASVALQKIVTEMENRYETFSEKQFKNIDAYNNWIDKHNKKYPDKPLNRLPFIVVIIDELADLMLVAAKDVEDSIMRITQMARAAGIHLIVATQRPSTDVITGLIKNNIPSRIAFSVASNVDSRTILDMGGAERLLGKGDMLYLPMGKNTPKRIQGCFISDGEMGRLIDYSKKQLKVEYDEEMIDLTVNKAATSDRELEEDPLYDEVLEFVVSLNQVSTSLIQRQFRFGYNRAARMMDLLEARGVIGPLEGSKPREVLYKIDNEED